MLICQHTRHVVHGDGSMLPFIVVVYHAHGRLWTFHHPNSEADEHHCWDLRMRMDAHVTIRCGERLPLVDADDRDEFMIRTFDNARRFVKQQVYMSHVDKKMQPGGGFAIHIQPYRYNTEKEVAVLPLSLALGC